MKRGGRYASRWRGIWPASFSTRSIIWMAFCSSPASRISSGSALGGKIPRIIGIPATRVSLSRRSIPIAPPRPPGQIEKGVCTVSSGNMAYAVATAARIAERLLEAQQNAAILTTFNEVNLKAAMDLRARHKDAFEKTHDVRLGFMSFFVKAAAEALKKFPVVNASVDGNYIVYHNYFDIGVAVGSVVGRVEAARDTVLAGVGVAGLAIGFRPLHATLPRRRAGTGSTKRVDKVSPPL